MFWKQTPSSPLVLRRPPDLPPPPTAPTLVVLVMGIIVPKPPCVGNIVAADDGWEEARSLLACSCLFSFCLCACCCILRRRISSSARWRAARVGSAPAILREEVGAVGWSDRSLTPPVGIVPLLNRMVSLAASHSE